MNFVQVGIPAVSILFFAPFFITAERNNNNTLLVIPTRLFRNCTLHFIMRNSGNIKHENIGFPYSLHTYSRRMDEIGEASFKRHWIFCNVLIPVLRETQPKMTLNFTEVYSAITLTKLMNHPLMVTIMSKPSNQSDLHSLVNLLTTRGTQVLCKFLFMSFIEKSSRSSQDFPVDSSNEAEVTGGACFCPTCYGEYKSEIVFKEFNCTRNRSECFEELRNACRAVSDNGARVAWKYEGATRSYVGTNMVTDGIEPSPMNRRNTTRMHKSIEMYLFRGMNWTNYPFDPLNNFSTPRVSTTDVKWHNEKYPTHGELYPVGFSKSYRFITNSEVYRPKATSGKYLRPLRQPVMQCLLAIHVLLVILMMITWKKSRCVTDFVLGFIWVSATLVEQSQRFPVEPNIRKYVRLVFLLWLFLAIVLSNAYKSVVKSELMVEAPYETRLESFQNISNLSTYVLTTNADCRGDVVNISIANRSSSDVCDGKVPVAEEILNACNFLKRLSTATAHLTQDIEQVRNDRYTVYQNGTYKIDTKEYLLQAFESWKRKVLSVCLPYINASNVIASLNVPEDSSAFIVPDAGHEYYWELFDEAMKTNHDLHLSYALNQKRGDDDLIKAPALIGTEKLDIWADSEVSKHARTLLSSGTYWLWEKWEAIIFPEIRKPKLLQRNPNPTNEPKGLSLRTARVYQAFRWYLTGIGVAMHRYIYERVSCSLRYQVLRLYLLAVWTHWKYYAAYKVHRILTALRSLIPAL